MSNINIDCLNDIRKPLTRRQKRQQGLLIDRFIPSRKATNLEAAFAIQDIEMEADIENMQKS